MLTILCWPHPNARRILWCLRSQFISAGRDPKNLTACLNGRKLNCPFDGRISTTVFSKSSNSQDHLFWAWRHPHSSPISRPGVYYDKWWLSYPSLCSLCPVVRRPRPAVVASRTVRSGVFHHWIHHLWPQGAVPPGFNPLRRGWVYRRAPEAPRKGECRRGPRHFWNCLPRWASALR